MINGSCLCGKVHYEIKEIHGPLVHCHCNYCRKAHTAAFSSNAKVKVEDFTIVKGKNFLHTYESSPGKNRMFCAKCGSHLWHEKIDTPGVITLKLGSIDTFDNYDSKNYQSHHINCDSDKQWLYYENLDKFPSIKPD